ncbi:MFS transporter [Paenibacillus sp. JJ-223]|uniref:MDR family MFS transporter n=1 Tax=Paenibacillus sp. JJ-223 TaxID=2905647 RepID=UPI001F3BB43C|nr:MFS transporter [Paenibacillus sp. JJ-223]CAH1203623.1 Na(+), Li(+), K(+)/H(+) antiporter [Paenibacillus sp. JJ-223]
MKYSALHRNIRIRIITDFFTDLTQKSILPFMAIYLSVRLGASWAGLLLTANILLSMLVSLGAGYWSDRIGRKKLMVSAQCIQVFALFWMAAANSPWLDSVWLTCIMFTFSSVSSGVSIPVANAMIVDVSSERERQYVYGLQYWTTNVAITFGALMGGLLFETNRFLLFGLVLAESVATLAILVTLIHETMETHSHSNVPVSRKRSSMFSTYGDVLRNRRFMTFFAATVLAVALEFQLDKYIAVRLKNEFSAQLFQWDITGLQMFSFVLAINTVLVALIALPFSKWMLRYSSRSVMTVGMVLYTLGFALLAVSNWAMLLIAAAVVYTIGELMYSPVQKVLLAGMIPDTNRAAYMAADSMSYNAAALMGSIGLSIGAILPSYAMACLYLLMGLGALCLFRSSLDRQTFTSGNSGNSSSGTMAS